jgi:YbgC/YbaW family acyl-CoA thioester hydrolase
MFRYHLRLIWIFLRYLRAGRPRAAASTLVFRASWFDCDALGHINNARYLEYFDAGRVDLLLRNGVFKDGKQNGYHLLVGGTTVRYRREVRWGKRFRLESAFARLDGKAVVIAHKIFLGETLATEAEVSVLCVQGGKVVDAGFLLPLLTLSH